MEKVRAKFTCNFIKDQPHSSQKEVFFTAVTSGSEENKSFSRFTPAASLNMSISYSTPASDFFEEGKEYYIDLTLAE